MTTSTPNWHVRSMPALRGIIPQLIQTAKAVEVDNEAKKSLFLGRWIEAMKVPAVAVIAIAESKYSDNYTITFNPAMAAGARLHGGTTEFTDEGMVAHTYSEYQLDIVTDFE